MKPTSRQSAMARALELLDPQQCAVPEPADHGYGDVLPYAPPVRSIAQRLMRTSGYSAVYQFGRPIARKLVTGSGAPSRDEDRTQVAELLGLGSGSVVFDIGCGPGNFTGWFGTCVSPDGLAVGVDASHAMLRRAVTDNSGTAVAYLRGDAENLPFADGVADAVSCLAALYLINDPFRAVGELARVLRPGGRAVILTSLMPGGVRGAARGAVLDSVSGIRWFGREEITECLADLGFVDIKQHVGGLSQTVTARKR
ncbi:methyltransferase domain-containing protein [Mycobacterium syngnathidarum]